MRLALIGYGKMGREIERVATERGVSVDLRLDVGTPAPDPGAMAAVDVAIHFAAPGSIAADLAPWAEIGKPIVVGTTGWNPERTAVEALVARHQVGLVAASNFSLGVNVMYQLVREAARAMNRLPEYDPFIHEVHHKDKLDSPSGTALALAAILCEELQRKTELLTQSPAGKILPHQLHVSSVRGGAVVGTHTVTFDSSADTIELTHRAKNRTGFALGALLAAEWVRGKKGYFTMTEVLADLLRPIKE